MCEHFEDLYNSVNPYFPNDHLMVTKSFMLKKNPFGVQERLIYFNVTEYAKFTELISDSLFQFTFKKLLLVEFDIASKKKIHERSINTPLFTIYFNPKNK